MKNTAMPWIQGETGERRSSADSRIKTTTSNGFTRLDFAMVVASLALVAILASRFLAGRRQPAWSLEGWGFCVNNLVKIDSAKENWAADHNLKKGAIPRDSDLFGASLYINTKPGCAAGGIYTLNPVGVRPTCSGYGHTWFE
jgi:hypothetical protein